MRWTHVADGGGGDDEPGVVDVGRLGDCQYLIGVVRLQLAHPSDLSLAIRQITVFSNDQCCLRTIDHS